MVGNRSIVAANCIIYNTCICTGNTYVYQTQYLYTCNLTKLYIYRKLQGQCGIVNGTGSLGHNRQIFINQGKAIVNW